MSKMGKFDGKGFAEFQKQLERLQDDQNVFIESCAKELAGRLLRMVVKRTPVGDYSHEIEVTAKRDSKNHKKGDVYKKRINPSGKKGGTLRRGWTGGKKISAKEYANLLPVHHFGGVYQIEITNPVWYAPYVEYGHRTASHRGWVQGIFMMTISEQELERIAPQILENKIKKCLERYLK